MNDFYCDNCSKKVPYGTEKCPFCERKFIDVTCPRCGFSGTERQFKDGCSACGYLSAVEEKKPKELKLWVRGLVTLIVITLVLGVYVYIYKKW